jgi:eukaryotic-like serine/threonine-protein kinase
MPWSTNIGLLRILSRRSGMATQRRERPDAAVVYSKLGWAYRLEGDIRQALSYYNQALMIDEADLLSLAELARYY